MYRQQQLVNHNQLHASVIRNSDNNACMDNNINMNVSATNTAMTNIKAQFILNSYFEKNIDYYRSHEKGSTFAYVVNKQFSLEKNISSSVLLVDPKLHTLIASVSYSQTKNESKQFAKLIYLVDTNNKTKQQHLIVERNYHR